MTTDALRQAIDWHILLPEADESLWAAFVAWLEADPAHAAAYDEVSADDALRGDVVRPLPVAANDTAPPVRRWRPMLVGAGSLAAACALFAVVALRPGVQPNGAQGIVVAATAVPRSITMGEDVRIALSQGARMRVDPADSRSASLESGSARFVVKHDPSHPFRLDLGGHALVDVGTVFRVDNDPARITVEVSEGGVMFDPDKAAVSVPAGRRLVYDRAADTVTLSALDGPAVAVAHPGSLSFVDAPLVDVTAAIGRASGMSITLDPALSGRRFSGVIKLTGSATRDVPHFAEVTGTRSIRDGEHWRIGPAGDANR